MNGPTSEVPSGLSPQKRGRKALRVAALIAGIVVLAAGVRAIARRRPCAPAIAAARAVWSRLFGRDLSPLTLLR